MNLKTIFDCIDKRVPKHLDEAPPWDLEVKCTFTERDYFQAVDKLGKLKFHLVGGKRELWLYDTYSTTGRVLVVTEPKKESKDER